jgi:sensor histidine kinase YesM
MMEKASAQNASPKPRRFFWQIITINLSAVIVVTMLNYVQAGRAAFSPTNLLSTIINSNCIGTLCGIVITRGVPLFYSDSILLRLAKIIAAIFAATLLGIIISNVLLNVFFGIAEGGKYFLPGSNKIIFSLIIALGFGLSSYFYELSQAKLRQKEIDEAHIKTLAAEAQLASLESKIHPHFLFNTLNSIAALIREDPVLAEKTVEKLSSLLRYSLDASGKSLASLKQEIEITEKYLEIEKVRFDERLIYKIDADERCANIKLPPLALQTLVENSIKHVASKTSALTEIIVSVAENGEKITIKVCDGGKGFADADLKRNHGLDNLNKRLQTLFDGAADLQILKNETGCVCLHLPK